MVQPVVPAGWPVEVRPPGVDGWEGSAARWLLDICPPEFRSYAVLRRHPVVLARFAVVQTTASHEAARRALGDARNSLRDFVAPDTTERILDAWEREMARLASRLRSVRLVEEALRGREFRPRL